MTQGVFHRGVDEAWAHATPTVLKALGYEFVCRYLSSDASKTVTPVEAQAILGAGLRLVFVFEDGGQNALGGFSQGVRDAELALRILNGLGAPLQAAVYMACDFQPTGAQLPVVVDYLRGAEFVLGVARTGVYAGYDVVRAAFDAGHVRYGWQTYAWSRGLWDERAQIQQYLNSQPVAGVLVDLDRATTSDFGGWVLPPTPVPAPVPTTVLELLVIPRVWEDPAGIYWLGSVDPVTAKPVIAHIANTADKNADMHLLGIGESGVVPFLEAQLADLRPYYPPI